MARALVQLMKTLHSNKCAPLSNPRAATRQTTERPLKICVVFDDDDSARSAQVLIRHVASDCRCEMQLFQSDDLDTPGRGIAAARTASGMDILVLAVRDDRMLPAHVRLWLGLYMGLRDANQEGALVVLIAQAAETANAESSLLEYLESIAAIRGMAFFPRHPGFAAASRPENSMRLLRGLPTRAASNSNGRIRDWACNQFEVGRLKLDETRSGRGKWP
jgi:hypothetical protein